MQRLLFHVHDSCGATLQCCCWQGARALMECAIRARELQGVSLKRDWRGSWVGDYRGERCLLWMENSDGEQIPYRRDDSAAIAESAATSQAA